MGRKELVEVQKQGQQAVNAHQQTDDNKPNTKLESCFSLVNFKPLALAFLSSTLAFTAPFTTFNYININLSANTQFVCPYL